MSVAAIGGWCGAGVHVGNIGNAAARGYRNPAVQVNSRAVKFRAQHVPILRTRFL